LENGLFEWGKLSNIYVNKGHLQSFTRKRQNEVWKFQFSSSSLLPLTHRSPSPLPCSYWFATTQPPLALAPSAMAATRLPYPRHYSSLAASPTAAAIVAGFATFAIAATTSSH